MMQREHHPTSCPLSNYDTYLRKSAIPFAALSPEAIALTTRLAPVDESPAANTLSTLDF